MDRRPKQRIWNGEEYESDADEDEKPRFQSLNSDSRPGVKTEMRSALVFYLQINMQMNFVLVVKENTILFVRPVYYAHQDGGK